MSTIDVGRVSIVHKGEWEEETEYERLDLVSHDGSSYIAITDTTGTEPPNDSYWALIAEKGDTGNSAYEAALASGYEGTEDEFALLWASLGEYAEKAETAAKASEDSALLSESWAIGGTDSRDGEDTDNSKYYAEQAESAAATAAEEAALAATEEAMNTASEALAAYVSAASEYAQAAASSESNAAASETAAASSAEDAEKSATNAATSETNAAASESAAAASATAAAASATAAATSANEAESSASAAESSAETAASSAEEAEALATALGGISFIVDPDTLKVYAGYTA